MAADSRSNFFALGFQSPEFAGRGTAAFRGGRGFRPLLVKPLAFRIGFAAESGEHLGCLLDTLLRREPHLLSSSCFGQSLRAALFQLSLLLTQSVKIVSHNSHVTLGTLNVVSQS